MSSALLVVFNAVTGRYKKPSPLDSFDFSKALLKLAVKTSKPRMRANFLSKLPQDVLKQVLSLLLVSTEPMILGIDINKPVASGLTPAVLRSSHYIYDMGREILYGSNTFTTSSPATSSNFDKDLLKLPGKNLQLIRRIELEIDWADQLWAKFPLIASALGSIQGLKGLKLTIVEPCHHVIEDSNEVVLMPKAELNGSRSGYPREGPMGQVMLKAEKKVLVNLVVGLRALQTFKLKGFADEKFARKLENWVSQSRTLLFPFYRISHMFPEEMRPQENPPSGTADSISYIGFQWSEDSVVPSVMEYYKLGGS